MGGSHSPSMSSSQSSGFLASGSGMVSGLSQSYNSCQHMKKLAHEEWREQLQIWTDLWLLIVRVSNLLPVVPVLRLLGFWVLDSFGRQEVPVVLQTARLHFLIINLDLVRVVWVDNQRVQVAVLIVLRVWDKGFGCGGRLLCYCSAEEKRRITLLRSHLASDVLVNQMVFPFVVENDVNFLRAGATNIRTWTHNSKIKTPQPNTFKVAEKYTYKK